MGRGFTMTSEYSKILVTGGAGFIGSHLVDRLLNEGFVVTVIDNYCTGKLENISHFQDRTGFNLIEGDIRDFNLVKKAVKGMDAIFHEAALASVSISVKDPILTNDVNVNGTLNLLKASTEFHIKRFIFASSAAVYGDPSLVHTSSKKEEMATNPTSPYGVSKLAAEMYIQLFYKIYGLETVSLRYFNVYGPRQCFDISSNCGGAITIFTNRLLRNMSPIIYGDGEQTRDFVFVQDIVEANMLALKSTDVAGNVFNIGTGKEESLNKVGNSLKEIIDKKDLKCIHVEPRTTDIRHGYADISKAQEILGYSPRIPLSVGLSKTVDWYNKNYPRECL